MTTLMVQTSGKKRRYCNGRCYDAKHDTCNCICGGINHGKGEEVAIKQTSEIVEKLLEEQNGTMPTGQQSGT